MVVTVDGRALWECCSNISKPSLEECQWEVPVIQIVTVENGSGSVIE